MVGASGPFTCAVPDFDYATRSGTEFGYQQENTSFSFWCGANESVVGLWNSHVWCARFLTVNVFPCCLLLSVIWHGFFSRLFVSSLLAALFEGQWSALPTSAHSRRDGSLTGQGLDTVCGVSRTSVGGGTRANTTPCAALRLDLRPNERHLERQSGDN